MPTQYMDIAPTPLEEYCAQVGSPDYEERSSRECLVFKRMLSRHFPSPENGKASIVVKLFPHDFGSYREVCVKYDDTDQEATEYALELEGSTPEKWDEIAQYELLWLQRQEERRYAYHRAGHTDSYTVQPIPNVPDGKSLKELLALYPLPDAQRQGETRSAS